MTTKTKDRKHTHLGHCQACARQHAANVKTNNIAKHGYTTRFGYFAGVCSGSDHKALELSREFADETVIGLEAFAVNQVALAAKLRNGAVTPTLVETGKSMRDERGAYVRDRDGAIKPEVVAWADATPERRELAVAKAINVCAANAAGARQHAKELAAIIPEIHGKPLTPVAPADSDEMRPLAVGDTVRLWGKTGIDAIVTGFKFETCTGRGPHLNGQNLNHAVMTRGDGKGVVTMPVKLIRRAAIIKRAGN